MSTLPFLMGKDMYPSPESNPWVGDGGLVNVTRVAPPVVFIENVAYRLMSSAHW